MPNSAYCSECGQYVWIGKDGGCAAGHPRSCLRDVKLASIDPQTGGPLLVQANAETKTPLGELQGGLASFVRGLGRWLGARGESMAKSAAGGTESRDSAPGRMEPGRGADGQLDESGSRGAQPPLAWAVALLAVAIVIGAILLSAGRGPGSEPEASSTGTRGRRANDWSSPQSSPPPESPIEQPYSGPSYVPDAPTIISSPERQESKCLVCDGRGETKCLMCSGRGTRECIVCSGTGTSYSGWSCASCGGTGQIECVTCDGFGTKVCTSCGGKGYR